MVRDNKIKFPAFVSLRPLVTDAALIIVPGVMAILGIVTILFALLGCFGMALKNKYHSIAFFAVNLCLMMGEICLGSYWWHCNKEFMQFPLLLEWFLHEDINTGEDWATLQIKVNLQCM